MQASKHYAKRQVQKHKVDTGYDSANYVHRKLCVYKSFIRRREYVTFSIVHAVKLFFKTLE